MARAFRSALWLMWHPSGVSFGATNDCDLNRCGTRHNSASSLLTRLVACLRLLLFTLFTLGSRPLYFELNFMSNDKVGFAIEVFPFSFCITNFKWLQMRM